MNYQETLRQFLLLGAALCKHNPSNDLERSQQAIVRDEILYNVEFATSMKTLFKTGMVFEGENGTVPTIKGWKALQPKVIEKPLNRMAIPDNLLIPMTTNLIQEICYRHKNRQKFVPILSKQIKPLGQAYNCLNETIVNVLNQ